MLEKKVLLAIVAMFLERVILLNSTLSVSVIVSLKVVNFEESLSETNISFLLLSSSSEVPLPELFVLCTSHQQSKMDKKGFYHIYGEDKQPWMMTKFSTGPGAHNSVGVLLDWSGFTLEKLHSPSCSFGITCATRSTPPEARFQCPLMVIDLPLKFKLKV